MKRLLSSRDQIAGTVVRACYGVIGLHLVNAALFHIEAPPSERIFWAALAAAAASAAAWWAPSLTDPWRGSLALAFGVPATMFGIALHAVHVYQLGVVHSHFTGLPMLVAGVLLVLVGGTVLVRQIHTWWRRLLLVPPGLVVGFFLIFPLSLSIAATNVARVPCCDETPADRGVSYTDVTFDSVDGRQLSAWYVAPRNGAVVIVVHGAGWNRERTMDEAMMLARNGYGLLMLDLGGFGESEGRANMFGWGGARDVAAAVQFLESRPEVAPGAIGGLGLSMGGEVLLQAVAETPGLTSIVAEGATGRTRDDFDEASGSTLIVPFWEVVETSMHVLTGEPPPPPFLDLVGRVAPRHVLFIAANLREEQELMGLYTAVGGPSFEMWTIPEPEHVGGFRLHPEEYERRVVEFFDRTLLLADVQTGVQ